MRERRPLGWVLPAALACFVLAALAGVLYRFGMVLGLPFELRADNVRHAHSHLMYFGWVTPLLMALLAARLPEVSGRPIGRRSTRLVGGVCLSAITLGLLAFIPFLLYGYASVDVGGSRLPLSMISAGLNVLPWYAFAAWYVVETRSLERTVSLRLFDGAVVFLVLSSAGAWVLAALNLSRASNLFLEASALHVFLDYFAEGWLVLGVLGLIHMGMPEADTPGARRGTLLLILGLPAIFLLALPSSLVPAHLHLVATGGGLMVAAGTLLHVHAVRRRTGMWRLVLVLLALKALGTGAYSLPLIGEWVAVQGLRLLYLHVLLLGVVTMGLLWASSETWHAGRLAGLNAAAVAVVALLLSLIPLTRLWPAEWTGRWMLILAAAAAVLPVLAAIRVLVASMTAPAPPLGDPRQRSRSRPKQKVVAA